MSDVVERCLQLSRADGCVVVLRESSRTNLRWAGSTLTTNGAVQRRALSVVSIVGESVGVRSATVVDDLEGLVRASEQAAREAGPAEDAAPLVGGSAAADFGEPAVPAGPEVFATFAPQLGQAFRARDVTHYGYASHEIETTWLGTSTGVRRRHVQPTGYVELTGKGAGGSAWVGRHTRDWSDVVVPDLEGELRRRLGWGARRLDLPAGRYETLLPPSTVADLATYAYWSASGRSADEGRSVYAQPGNRVGERVGPPGLRMWSDPADPALGTAPFVVSTASSAMSSVFDNGLPLRATDWVRDGVLTALVHTRASAARTGAPVTPYIPSLQVDAGGTASTDDMVAGTGRGLLLTCLWYIREVDPQTLLLTGLTRDGVYLVEDGQVVGAVNNFRWNESPLDVLRRASEVGRSEPTLPREWSDDFTWVRMPTLRVPDFNMSSVSQAS